MSRECRFCHSPLTTSFADLGMSPLSNSFLSAERLSQMEPFYPLHAYVCNSCFLVQLEEFETPEQIFSDYVYFSSFSQSWLQHAEHYVDTMIERFGLSPDQQIIEIASNDGYLLQYFQQRTFSPLGIEPAANVAQAAIEKGIATRIAFFGTELAKELASEGTKADLIAGNNVLAHVPNLNDFVAGLAIALQPEGVITLEFPHLLRLIDGNQFDTIYHEHFSYLSLSTVGVLFKHHGLRVFDVEELRTHGGSIRVFACHENADHRETEQVANIISHEQAAGLKMLSTYAAFQSKITATKRGFLRFLLDAQEQGKQVAAYGAAAKGNTLLNFCGVGPDLISYVVDKNPHKQGLYLPGSHLPVYAPEFIKEGKPDYIVLLPWNLAPELTKQLEYTRSWGCKIVVPVPGVQFLT